MSENKPIQLGLCCLNITMRNKRPTIFASRSCTMGTIAKSGLKIAVDRARMNLDDILTLMHWNEENGIKVFRLTSNIFAHISNPKIGPYNIDFAKPKLKEIGELAKKYNQRLTFHPGQYDVLGTPDPRVLKNTLLDLKVHADILDLIGCNQDSVMVIHGGGFYGDKPATIERWVKNYKEADPIISNRLVLENCEKCFSIKDCLIISEKSGVPVVFDTHHFECYKKLHPDEEFESPEYYIPLILETWKKRGIKPKFHVSEQGAGRVGHHSDYIETIPDYLLEIPEKYGVHIDIMIEAKKKELAIQKLYEKYPHLDCRIKEPVCEKKDLKIRIKVNITD